MNPVPSQPGEPQRLRRAMRDLVALSTLPAIWAGSDPQRIPESLANVLAGTLDLDVVYVRVSDPQHVAEWLRAPPQLSAAREQTLEALRAVAAAEMPPSEISAPITQQCLRCAISRFGMGDVSGVVVAATAAREFPSEEDRVLLGVAANHACAELYRRRTERTLQASVAQRKLAQEELEALLGRQTRRANLLGRVADAGRKMNAVREIESIAQILTEEARDIIGSHQAVTSLTVSEDWAQAINSVSLSDKYAAYRAYDAKPDGSGIYALVCRTNMPMRMTQEQLHAHPAWRGFGAHASGHPPMRGWLAVPLVGHGGRNLGLIQLSDKHVGEFDQEDEDVLLQLAAVAAAGIENARFYNELRVQARRKDEFLAVLAHELRNPLAPLRNAVSLLELSQSNEHAEQVRQIMKRQVAHMARLIDDLLDVSRITTGKVQLRPETVNLRRILDAALEVSRPAIERAGHQLVVSMPGEVQVKVDPTRMAQVVSNLLNNAAKYTRPGGRIELGARICNGEVEVFVTDNGAGLSAEALPEIFELFTQVGRTIDHSEGGLGIGLALVKKLVEMHGGSVEAKSPGLGRGSTFTVRLPAALADSDDQPVTGSHRTQGRKQASRILVVDDNVDAASTLSAVLEMAGHTTRTCHSGAAALDEVEAFGPEVVLLDIGLPGMDGYEVARRLRATPSGSKLTLVAVTGWGSESDRRRTREAGFDEHLTKPVEFDRLEWVLAQLARPVALQPDAAAT